jgi:pyrroloquinoline quinone (PQQ) biosynthesis protein C/quercetin dioxygenase-like cupin family protein
MLMTLTEPASAQALSAEQFVDALQAQALTSRTVAHPLLDDIAEGRFVDLPSAIKRFLSEYYFYSYRFTRFLAATMASLYAPEHRAALVGNSAEESGHLDEAHRRELAAAGIEPDHVAAPHPELFRRFLGAIGLDRQAMLERMPHIATAAWVDTMEDLYRHGGQEQAVGALGIATEGIVRPMYQKLLDGIARAWPDLRPEDRAFFDLHAAVDDEHAEVLRGIAIALAKTPASRRALAIGVTRALNARGQFFDEMQHHLRSADAPARPRANGTAPLQLVGAVDSAAFADVGKNRNSLVPIPALQPDERCVHAKIAAGAITTFSAERGHPVYPIKLPSRSVSMSIGVLAPGASTSNHRHAYESLVYVVAGRGYTIMEGKRFAWEAGDAFYTPPWCWHQHFAADGGAVTYLTATNMPMLHALGQTVLREEEEIAIKRLTA